MRAYVPRSVNRLVQAVSHFAPSEAIRRYSAMSGIPLDNRYRGVCRGIGYDIQRRLIGDQSGQSQQLVDSIFEDCFNAVKTASPLNRMLYVDTKIWLPDDLLVKADKMTMASGVELRVPFLDHKLVEFAATVPDYLKIDRTGGKVLLRQAMQQVLPDMIIKRSKKGFPTPIAAWLRSSLKSFTRDSLLGPDSACSQYMDRGPVANLIREHEQGRGDRSQEIWSLLVFEHWCRAFLRSPERSAREWPTAAAPNDRLASGRPPWPSDAGTETRESR
jgi:asparagine synthase (glutamine-hydrolysing)